MAATAEDLTDDIDPDTLCLVGVRRLHSQDPIHNVKKLDNVMESVRSIPLGPKDIAQSADFVYIFETYGAFASRLTRNAVLRQDRQNFGDCLLRSSLDCCRLLRESGYKSTALMYDMHRRSIQIFLGERLSMYERAVNCGYVIHFMRLQRLFVKHHPTTNLSQHTWTYQTYLHVQLSCHDAILLMKATRDFSPSVDFGGTQTGSDCLEKVFRNAGGFGAINAGTRNYTLGEFLTTEGRHGTLKTAQTGDNGLIVRNRSKFEYKPDHVENMDLEPYSLKCDMDDETLIKAMKVGQQQATADLFKLGIVPNSHDSTTGLPDAAYNAPWLNEEADIKMMRSAKQELYPGEYIDYDPNYIHSLLKHFK